MSSLDQIRFRANPSIELVPFAALAAGERERFRELESDRDAYGLFLARPPLTATVKAAARQTADLFASLAAPSLVEASLLDDVVELVLDGILEIESGDGFVSGADALRAVRVAPCDAGGALSRAALMHAEELASSDPHTLAMALYHYNNLPITRAWRARFSSADAVRAHVGADRGALRSLLGRDWTHSVYGTTWLAWSAHAAPHRGPERPAYKLYVSPRPERIRDAFQTLVRVLASAPATFKMGGDAAGLLRPDKLVAYFATREELDEAASRMRRELAGCEAHGVPFTAPLDDDGLLSWGVDPPENERVLRWLHRSSWRLWIARRLGSAMATARAARTSSAVESWRFAVTRVSRLGVDVGSWTPSAALWSGA
ncbi:MAG TPA: hypothetical protein VF824_15425 [Thermoanaerobaculia bacterium]|jgi:hypothetical protein